MKIAIVHDWLVTYAGAEKVLEQILYLYPQADVFTLIDFLPSDQREFLQGKKVVTSFVQNLPFAKKKYRNYLPIMPFAIEQLDLSDYDLIISSSHAVAKGVITGPDQLHISYVHSPIRYAWDMQFQYFKESGLNKGIKGWLAKSLMHYIRLWDYRTANGVDFFVANSKFIARRIMKIYHREAEVIYPPVDIDRFTLSFQKEDFYFTASRLVPYKKVELIVEAFSEMPDKKLIVIGDGPEFYKIKAKAGKNVKMLGYQPTEVLIDYLQRAKAFVFAAEEDFGIVPVEAQACGTPVIAYGKGGVLETVNSLENEKPTGLFFYSQDIRALKEAVLRFESNINQFHPIVCRENAKRFSTERFREEFYNYVEQRLEDFNRKYHLLKSH